jgi:hypothetical protein
MGSTQPSYYSNDELRSGINNYASTPSTSYYAANQQMGSNYEQGYNYNWQQNNYQQQQG